MDATAHLTQPAVDVIEEAFVDLDPLPFAMARYPTTVAAYRKFIEAGGYRDRRWWSARGWAWRDRCGVTEPTFWDQPAYSHPKLPIVGISFWEAEAYARFRGAELPTEHEWYLVASNGGRTRYPWGDDAGEDTDRANLAFFGTFSRSERLPVDRSSKSASVHGVCDLIGNTGEWCLPGTTTLADAEETAVLRGGSCWHVPGVADASFRDVVPLVLRDNQTGIRLVRRRSGGMSATAGSMVLPTATRPLGRAIKRPTAPFRREGLPSGLTEATWRLTVGGHGVARPHVFSLADVKATFDNVTDEGLFVCVCRWGQPNSFTGVRLRDLLDACRVPWREQVLYLLQRSVPSGDGLVYETTVPIREAVEHQAMLAWAMDGQPLTLELGWPLRYVDWTLYGYKCVKCLAELVVTTKLEPGWWERKCQYDLEGTIRPGTITVVGDEASRFEITTTGRVRTHSAVRKS